MFFLSTMSMSRKNLSLLRRHLARREKLTKPLSGPQFRKFHYNYRSYPHVSALSTAVNSFSGLVDARDFSSNSSSGSMQDGAQKDTIGWRALSSSAKDIIDNPMWLIPRKGTGKDAVEI